MTNKQRANLLVGGKRWIPQSELAKVGQRVDG
jgi:hypothetical protein